MAFKLSIAWVITTNLLVAATDPHLEQFLELARLASKLVPQQSS